MRVEYIYYHQDVCREWDPEPRAGTEPGHNPPVVAPASWAALNVGDLVEALPGWFVEVRSRCLMADDTLRVMVVDQGARWMVQ